jgi:hypothetical protein
MFTETLAVAGVVVSAIGIGLAWYKHHLDKGDRKKEKEKQEADYSIGQNVAGLP